MLNVVKNWSIYEYIREIECNVVENIVTLVKI